MHLTKYIVLLMITFFSVAQAQNKPVKSLFCYGDVVPERVENFDYVVLESAWFSSEDIQTFKTKNKAVLAYISLGEVSETASFYEDVKDETLGKNPIWNSHILNIEAEATRKALWAQIEMFIKTKQFQGIFIDNIDNYTSYGPTPEKQVALLSFLSDLKRTYPGLIIMQNAGIQILESTKKLIDAIAIESIASDYNFKNETYNLREKSDYKSRLRTLEYIKTTFNIPTIAIEYAQEEALKSKIEKRFKRTGISVFVGQIDLQKIPNWYLK
jgi:hypothetical protein